jgi:adenylate cyclase
MQPNRIFRAIIIALVSFIAGSGIDYKFNLETNQGLDWLFHWRGVRQPPTEVVVIAMDEISEEQLNAGRELTQWRRLHAKLVDELQRQGAALIVFDLQFITYQPSHDEGFAKAMKQAGNVLVTECYQKQGKHQQEFSGRDECSESMQKTWINHQSAQNRQSANTLPAVRVILPNPALTAAVLDHAPFYLPNDAKNQVIKEAWTYGDIGYTLPVMAWTYYLDQTGRLKNLIKPELPFSIWFSEQRKQCEFVTNNLKNISQSKSRFEQFLFGVICGDETRLLDYYGPPKTLRIESYSDVYNGKVNDLKGKIVFVGKANRLYLAGKTDFFQTPFTDTATGKMAGVEIMATLFANLLEERAIEMPFPPNISLPLYGLIIGLLLAASKRFVIGFVLSLFASAGYVIAAVWLFKTEALWLPLTVPLLIQFPLALIISLLFLRIDLLREQKQLFAFVQRVFPKWLQYLPSTTGTWSSKTKTSSNNLNRDVSGLCLVTDIEGYTSVAAHHPAHQMWELMNAYYQLLGQPVAERDGFIADVAGDAMIAFWIDMPPAQQRLAACQAALAMHDAVNKFNESSQIDLLPTRIGLHEGEMTLGELDVGNTIQFRAIGDTVNTASRIQGMNKYLGTRILVSGLITSDLAALVYRPVGVFLLAGKDTPIDLYEIVGNKSDTSPRTLAKLKLFAKGLLAFQSSRWEEAISLLQTLLKRHASDGPTEFYLQKAIFFRDNPPPDGWQGVIEMDVK